MGVGALLIFVGVALFSSQLVAPLARVLGWPAARIGGAAGSLARDNAQRNPQRTASTASALMIGLALVTLVAMLAAGIIGTFNSAVDDLCARRFYAITAQNNFSPIPISAADAAAKTPGRRGDRERARRRRPRLRPRDDTRPPSTRTIGTVINLDWKEGSQAVLAQLGADGRLRRRRLRQEPRPRVGLAVRAAHADRQDAAPDGAGHLQAAGRRLAVRPGDDLERDVRRQLHDQPKNLFTFVTMKGGETDANTAALDASARRVSRTPRSQTASSSSTTRSRGSRASSTSSTSCSRSRCSSASSGS